MKVLDALRKAIVFSRPGEEPLSRPIQSEADIADVGRGYEMRLQGDMADQDMVVSVVNFLATNVQSAHPRVSRKEIDGLNPVPDHQLVVLLNDPNPDHTGIELMQATIGSLAVHGEAFWRKVRSRAGLVVELYYTPCKLMTTVLSDDTALISHYEYQSGRGLNRTRLEREDVVHFRFSISDDNQAKGLSPLRSIDLELYTDRKAAEYTGDLLRNGMNTTLLTPEPVEGNPMPEPALERLRAYFRRLGRGSRRGEVEVIGGPMRSQQLGYSPSEMNLRELRRIPEERLSSHANLPAVVLGLGAGLDRSTFANFAEAKEMAYEGKVVPSLDAIAATIQKYLLPDFESDPRQFVVDFDLSKVRILQEDTTKKATRLKEQLTAGGITVAEYRTGLGYEVNPGDDVYLRPIGVIEVPASGTRFVEPGSVPPSQQQTGPPPEPDDDDEDETAAFTPDSDMGDVKAAPYQEAIIEAIKRDRDRLMEIWQPALIAHFEEFGVLVASIADDYLKDTAVEVKQELDPEDIRIVNEIIDDLTQRGEYQAWINRAEALWGQHYLRTATMTVDTINAVLELGVQLPDPVSRRIISEGGTRMGLLDIPEDTRRGLFQALHDGRVAGEGPLQLSRRIRQYVPAGRYQNAGTAYRALVIARTETRYAQNISSLETYRLSPRIRAMLCFDAQAGRTDADCTDRNGREFSYDDAMLITSAEHPNGTLDWAPIYGQPI